MTAGLQVLLLAAMLRAEPVETPREPAAAAEPAGSVAAASRVVVLPLQNLTRRRTAPVKPVVEALHAQLAAKGYTVVAGQPVEEFLEKRRIRYLDSLAAPALQELFQTLEAGAVVFPALHSFTPGQLPTATIGARLVSPTGETWKGIAVASADDHIDAFGVRKAVTLEKIIADAVKRLGRDLPRPGAVAARRSPPGRPGLQRRPQSFMNAKWRVEGPHRVAVLPFTVRTSDPTVGRVLAVMATEALAGNPRVRPIEAADVRRAAQEEQISTLTGMSHDEMQRLAQRLGTPYFLFGAVYAYDSVDARGSDPSVDLHAAITNVETGRVMWAALDQRRGRDYERLFLRGAIDDRTVLGHRVLEEMFEELAR